MLILSNLKFKILLFFYYKNNVQTLNYGPHNGGTKVIGLTGNDISKEALKTILKTDFNVFKAKFNGGKGEPFRYGTQEKSPIIVPDSIENITYILCSVKGDGSLKEIYKGIWDRRKGIWEKSSS